MEGWIDWADTMVSSHFNQRINAADIWLVVIHGISWPEGHFGNESICQLLAGKPFLMKEKAPDTKVSAHFLIRRSGELIQFVSIFDKAWHAGASECLNQTNCNQFSIGIELEGQDHTPYTNWQYSTLNRLLKVLKTLQPITHITGHQDIAPSRKSDPGPAFHWHLIDADLALAKV